MTNKQLSHKIKLQLEKLPFQRSVDFALDICKRLLPDYINFHQKRNWGDPVKLKEAITFCEISKFSLKIDEDKVKEYKEAVEAVTPDMDDFGDCDGSYALNAACSVLELLDYIIDKDKVHLWNISTLMADTIDFKLREEDESLTHEHLVEHPQLLKELHYQLELTK
ncbi:DUF416 family protein [Botryobacter ruber]|uniref:DUF416 family protein n=1 Tax=Botryobacter ruber TaxID=2171629 RepID=UPI000F6514E3|nr:DUF416 family protein [Botryobacter ruber]